jgi:hypothetical protein
MSDSENRPDTQSSRPDVVLIWEELSYFGKSVVKDRLDKVNFRSNAPQPEFEFV